MRTSTLGFSLAILSGLLQGTVDISSQYLTHNLGMSAWGFVSVTMGLTSLFLLVYEIAVKRTKAFTLVFNRTNFLPIFLFGLLLLFSQWLYYGCIQHSTAATASVLVSTRPFWILLFCFLFFHAKASWKVLIYAVMAVGGVWLMATEGKLSTLSISLLALGLGIGGAITGALYSIVDKKVVNEVGVGLASAWAMTIVAIGANIFEPFWTVKTAWNMESIFCVLWVVIIGNIFSYMAYFVSADKINPALTGLLVTVQPITTTVLSLIILGAAISWYSILGGILILLAVVLLSFQKSKENLIKS